MVRSACRTYRVFLKNQSMGRTQTAAGVRDECGYRKQIRPEAMMINTKLIRRGFPTILLAVMALPAGAQSFRVQCPTSTVTHPTAANAEPLYTAPTTLVLDPNKKFLAPTANVNGAIKCQQISGGDGYSTMGDGTQTYMFSFGPLSGLTDISNGLPGTEVPSVFNTLLPDGTYLVPGDPATSGITFNGAVGLAMDIPNLVSIYDISVSGNTVRVVANAPLGVNAGDMVTIAGTGTPYDGTFPVLAATAVNPFFAANLAFTY